ncbi:MAG TPA: dienelactone hydrolase family protein, partial [Lachnospiraceae bacterium]|nr:dienelactone hydrolase family protein [Lachnospiraceae bacterium]
FEHNSNQLDRNTWKKKGVEMDHYIRNSSTAILVLHEIYGINSFIKDICALYHKEGFDVYSPNLYGNEKCFSYENAEEAYRYFIHEYGFDIAKDMIHLIKNLKKSYKKVIVIGFSIGATIAWRCSDSVECDAVICCYGSRIRDYLDVMPKCPTYTMFAEEDSFDVDKVCEQLAGRENVEILRLNAHHGFLDSYSTYYCKDKADIFDSYRREVILNRILYS